MKRTDVGRVRARSAIGEPQGRRRRFGNEALEAEAGYSLLEAMVAGVLLVITLFALLQVMSSSLVVTATNRENAAAVEGARQVLEDMKDQPFSQIFALYGSDGATVTICHDPPPPGNGVTLVLPPAAVPAHLGHGDTIGSCDGSPPAANGPGMDFVVVGLNPQPGDADGKAGEILFPTDGAGALVETAANPDLGMPRDLNGDGFVDGVDHSSDYLILPVEVRVAWRGRRGNRVYSLRTILYGEQ